MYLVKLRRNNKPMKSFPDIAPLKFVSIDNLGGLFTTPRNSRNLLVLLDWFSMFVRTIPLKSVRRVCSKSICDLLRHYLRPTEMTLFWKKKTSRQDSFNRSARYWVSRTSSRQHTTSKPMVNSSGTIASLLPDSATMLDSIPRTGPCIWTSSDSDIMNRYVRSQIPYKIVLFQLPKTILVEADTESVRVRHVVCIFIARQCGWATW